MTFNTEGLADGDYYCNLVVRDNFQHETIIPVHLLVDTYLGETETVAPAMDVDIFPNPFNEVTNIRLLLTEQTSVNIRVADLQGRTIDMIASGELLPAGEHHFNWEPEEHTAGEGMFFIIFEHNGARVVKKVIRHE